MKKVSTVAAKHSRNFSQPKLTIGLDLGQLPSRTPIGSSGLKPTI
jgi:hypothetical protein